MILFHKSIFSAFSFSRKSSVVVWHMICKIPESESAAMLVLIGIAMWLLIWFVLFLKINDVDNSLGALHNALTFTVWCFMAYCCLIIDLIFPVGAYKTIIRTQPLGLFGFDILV